MLATFETDTPADRPILAHPPPLAETWFSTEVRDIHGWSNRPVAPWRRYFARYLDTMVHGFSGLFIAGYIGGAIWPDVLDPILALLDGPGGRIIEIMLTVFLAALVGAVVVGVTGASIGKAIFGVKVVDGEMRPIGLWSGLKRELFVWSAGLGFGIPLLSFVMLIISYKMLRRRATTMWDEGHILVLHRPATRWQTALNVFGVILSMLVFIAFKQME